MNQQYEDKSKVTGLTKHYEQVRAFHAACDESMPQEPKMLDRGGIQEIEAHYVGKELMAISDKMRSRKHPSELTFQASLLIEEIAELMFAGTIEDQVDALTDALYIIIGRFTKMGLNPEPFFDIVNEANMAKVGPDGKAIRDETGKIIKPDGWAEKWAPEGRIRSEIAWQRREAREECPACDWKMENQECTNPNCDFWEDEL